MTMNEKKLLARVRRWMNYFYDSEDWEDNDEQVYQTIKQIIQAYFAQGQGDEEARLDFETIVTALPLWASDKDIGSLAREIDGIIKLLSQARPTPIKVTRKFIKKWVCNLRISQLQALDDLDSEKRFYDDIEAMFADLRIEIEEKK